MKRCPNPECHSSFLFSDSKTNCPFCHTRLVSSSAAEGQPHATSVDFSFTEAPPDPQPDFLQHFGREITCTGRVLEIDHQTLFYGKLHKLFNAIVRGEPYQFAHQTIEYTIRVEPITEGIPSEVTDFCLFGSYLGRLQVGDEIRIRAKDCSDRRIVRSIYNMTTNSEVKPGLQLSAAVVRLLLALAVILVGAFLYEIIYLFESGIVAAALIALLSACMPILIILFVLLYLFRTIFPSHRRR